MLSKARSPAVRSDQPVARRLVPNLKFLVVTGPRIDHRSLPRPRSVRLRGYVADLQRQLAACDLAIVQGGLTTCMELTACRRPFIYVPLQNHFEQNFHVRHRLDRYGAGRCTTYDEVSDPAHSSPTRSLPSSHATWLTCLSRPMAPRGPPRCWPNSTERRPQRSCGASAVEAGPRRVRGGRGTRASS